MARSDRARRRCRVDGVGRPPGVRDLRLALRHQSRLGRRRGQVRRARPHLRNHRHLDHRASDRGSHQHRHRLVPDRHRATLAARADRHRRRAARRHSQHHLRHVGPVRVRPVHGRACRAVAQRQARSASSHRGAVHRAADRHRPAHRFDRPRDHDHPLHHRRRPRRVQRRPRLAQGSRGRARFDPLGDPQPGDPALHALGDHRRDLPRPRTGARRDDGGDLRSRQCARSLGLAADAEQLDRRGDRQRVHRSRQRALSLLADRARLPAVRRHLPRAERRQADADAPRANPRKDPLTMPLRRKLADIVALLFALAATLFGLTWLVWILWTTLAEGAAAITPALFTQMTPPPGSSGGLLNAFYGSAVMVLLALAIGTPLGIAAGTYLAEHGRHSRLAAVVSFLNDVLLSAPSIVIGLFVYELVVRPAGHFSGYAGSIALAMILLPIVVRTTDESLRLVPNQMREAAFALGLPAWRVTSRIIYKSALSGIVTGVLLGLARIAGETAPLLFTALNNQFWSANLAQPLANVPVVIFQYAMSPYDEWHALAWAGALVLTVFVLGLNLMVRFVARRGNQ